MNLIMMFIILTLAIVVGLPIYSYISDIWAIRKLDTSSDKVRAKVWQLRRNSK